jgi:hypothetical protein
LNKFNAAILENEGIKEGQSNWLILKPFWEPNQLFIDR